MTKLSKEDKMKLFKEWKYEYKGAKYLSKKYGVNVSRISYLLELIDRHGFTILDNVYTYHSKEFKEEAINRVLLSDESINNVALELGLSSAGLLDNWIRSYKENGYNIVIKSKGCPTREKREEQRTREAEARKRRTSSPEFKAYCRKCIHKKLNALVQKRSDQPKQK